VSKFTCLNFVTCHLFPRQNSPTLPYSSPIYGTHLFPKVERTSDGGRQICATYFYMPSMLASSILLPVIGKYTSRQVTKFVRHQLEQYPNHELALPSLPMSLFPTLPCHLCILSTPKAMQYYSSYRSTCLLSSMSSHSPPARGCCVHPKFFTLLFAAESNLLVVTPQCTNHLPKIRRGSYSIVTALCRLCLTGLLVS
jgi:hypothetical protein